MENKENYIRKDVVKHCKNAIVNIFNLSNRPTDFSVVEVIDYAKEKYNLNKYEELELYMFVKYTQDRFMRFFNVVIDIHSK